MRSAWRCAILVLLMGSGAVLRADPGYDISQLYVEAASDAIAASRYEQADSFARIALEFAPDSSDALYLRALIESRWQRRALRAIRDAERSLEIGGWQRYTAAHATVLLLSLYNRIGRSDEVVARAAVFPRDPATADRLLAEYYLEYLRALFQSAGAADRDLILSDARDRFPDDARFFHFHLLREPFPGREQRRELERLIELDSPGLDEAIYEYGIRVANDEERAWALARLRERGWDDPAIARIWVRVDENDAVGAFLERDGLRDYGTYRELLTTLDEPGRQRLLAQAAGYSGPSEFDPDRDGIWNERLVVEDGTVRRWERDLDQDGIVETALVFESGRPTAVIRRDEEVMLELRYDQYPFLGEAEIRVETGSETYVLRPRAVRLDAVENLSAQGPRFGSDLRLSPVVRPVTRRELHSASVQIDLVDQTGTLLERSFYEGGVMSQVQRDENGDGIWDHLLLMSGGFAQSGLRDLDADGYYEVAEGYWNGRLVALAVDADHDGLPEVFERHGEVPVREWDLNEDGIIDVREFFFWTDAVIREFPLGSRSGE